MNETPMEYEEARRIARDYVCAQCWGPLIILPDARRRTIVVCPQCGELGEHSKRFVEKQKQLDHARAAEARQNLGSILGVQKRSEAQILAELGLG